MTKSQRKSKFDQLASVSKRIIRVKEYLFEGVPYRSKMKPGKESTYDKLNRMQNENIEAVANLFKA